MYRLSIIFSLACFLCVTTFAQYTQRVPDTPRTPDRTSAYAELAQKRRITLDEGDNSPAPAPQMTDKANKMLKGIGKGFNQKQSIRQYLFPLFMVFLLVAAAVGGMILYNHVTSVYATKGGYNSPPRLFNELCKLHTILPEERQFLKVFAERNRYIDPLILFIEPVFFQQARANPEQSSYYHMLDHLLIKIFGIPYEVTQIGDLSQASGAWSGQSGEWSKDGGDGGTFMFGSDGNKSGGFGGEAAAYEFDEDAIDETMFMPLGGTAAVSSTFSEVSYQRPKSKPAWRMTADYYWDDAKSVMATGMAQVFKRWAPTPRDDANSQQTDVDFRAQRKGINVKDLTKKK